MSNYHVELVPYKAKYREMPIEKRKAILPERNVCSIKPSEDHADSISTGNGFQRIDILGDPYNDELAFFQEALYAPQWSKTPEPADLTGVMPEVRRLLLEGKLEEAGDLVHQAQMDAGFGPLMNKWNDNIVPPTSLRLHKAFWLQIKQMEAGDTKNYLRWLDMMTGKVTIEWENDKGAFSRELLAAYKDDVVVQRLTAPKGELTADISICLPDYSKGSEVFGHVFNTEHCSYELDLSEELITLKWAYNPEYGQKGYVSVIRLIRKGGKAEGIDKGIGVSEADSLIVLSKTVKFEGDFTFKCAKPIVDEVMAMDIDFDELIDYNREYMGSRMERSRLFTGNKDDFALSAEELLIRSSTDDQVDPMLMDKLYDMGRFYQIMDTGEIPPMWGQHNINTNLQVCAGNNTGLFDEMDVYFKYYETKFDDFRINAQKLFGARGLLGSVHCDYDSGLFYHFSKTYPHYCWTGCLGWIYNELWGYWLVTGDKEFLRNRLVPALKEIALFFEDYACDRGPDGHVIFYPSFSPENPTPNPNYATVTSKDKSPTRINSVMDIAICREVLDNLITACQMLGIESESIPHWEAQRKSLPTYLLDESGGLKEWSWPSIEENYNHRHVSHHYDLWPGRVVTPEREPELAKAIKISNRMRGQQDDSAHGIIHRCLSAIRLKDIDETMQNLTQLINHGFVTSTLQTRHFPYRGQFPDLQGAMPAILLEMCIFSEPGTVEFLPAIPESLGKGAIEGVWLYTWAKLERMDWSEKTLKCTLVSNKDQILTLRCRRNIKSFWVNGSPIKVNGDHIQYSFKAGEKIKVEIVF
ncbi:MAG TPA: glycoside hydrolase N-terminal domain-containing protein [Clostridia bacterium]|nr:glycoside hydrolase N-terminal domain-containing protein [Clostridia bacterium]